MYNLPIELLFARLDSSLLTMCALRLTQPSYPPAPGLASPRLR